MIFCSCSISKSSQKRFIQQALIKEDNLRFDGYYYDANRDSNLATCYVFYKNGRTLNAGSFVQGLNEKENELKSKQFLNALTSDKSSWTNFFIQEDSIGFEQIFPWQFYPHYVFSGHIINDTTFVLTALKGIYHIPMFQKRVTPLNDTFHFKHFYPKPDSI